MITFPPIEALSFAPLTTEEHGRGQWMLRVDMPVAVTLFSQTLIFTIPAGFVSDGASVPWWSRKEFDSWGRCALPAILHDWLLKNSDIPKWQKDVIFFIALREQDVPEFHAGLMYLGVRTRH